MGVDVGGCFFKGKDTCGFFFVLSGSLVATGGAFFSGGFSKEKGVGGFFLLGSGSVAVTAGLDGGGGFFKDLGVGGFFCVFWVDIVGITCASHRHRGSLLRWSASG